MHIETVTKTRGVKTFGVRTFGAAFALALIGTLVVGIAGPDPSHAASRKRLECPPPSELWFADPEKAEAQARTCDARAKRAEKKKSRRKHDTAGAGAAGAGAAAAAAGAASAASARAAEPAERKPFTEAEQAAATVPGIPDARFWADSTAAYEKVLGHAGKSWLALSAGGEDSAFGAGLMTGLSQSGKRPDYAVVTGVSSGALLAPFVFLGSHYDEALRENITEINAAEVFEDRRTATSLLDTWPLRKFIARRITPDLLKEIAREYARGRRLIVITTNIDAARPVAWNMGAIAAAGTDASLKLFRDILAASSAIPGLFPPVTIETEANGRRIQEMHVDGGLAATIYVAPDSMLLATSTDRLPMSELTVVVNGKLRSEFSLTDSSLIGVLGRSLSIGVKRSSSSIVALAAAAARKSGTTFNLAAVDQKFDEASTGLFDQKYMSKLFAVGLAQGKSATPFETTVPERSASRDSAPAATAPTEAPQAEAPRANPPQTTDETPDAAAPAPERPASEQTRAVQ
ncbi:hypothetical protein A33M_0666 [Rhodovulum sp. PH10]|uniref:patatin-like phospholipase family protein n=1 Tax=Rhodovulum sp. PH10 TaxID=1187851 RepID=UPI00027C2BDB|nr:patatin-like phospholipase family protein [Rhodovulum sp. PH10]EJW10047.1 hypothetical protein A33M_0666 [Rhodovulum sp. PH10]